MKPTVENLIGIKDIFSLKNYSIIRKKYSFYNKEDLKNGKDNVQTGTNQKLSDKKLGNNNICITG